MHMHIHMCVCVCWKSEVKNQELLYLLLRFWLWNVSATLNPIRARFFIFHIHLRSLASRYVSDWRLSSLFIKLPASISSKIWKFGLRKIPIKESSIVWFISVHAWYSIVCLTNILHSTYVALCLICRPVYFSIRTVFATMECSALAGVIEAVKRINVGSELTAIAMSWLTLDDFFLRPLKLGPTHVSTKLLGLRDQNNWSARKHHAHTLWSVEDNKKIF